MVSVYPDIQDGSSCQLHCNVMVSQDVKLLAQLLGLINCNVGKCVSILIGFTEQIVSLFHHVSPKAQMYFQFLSSLSMYIV